MEEKNYKKFEDLKKENPWSFLFQEQSDEDILQHLIDWNWEFVHPGDREVIKKHDDDPKIKDENKKFVLHKLPKPYRGNLKNPKLVILSLNPGFNDRVNRVLFNILSHEHQIDFIKLSRRNLMLEDGCRVITNELDDVLDNGYWTRQLSEIEEISKKKEKNDSYLDRIGLMQYIPYASKYFDAWDDKNELETQKFTKKIIHHLLEKTDALFLVLRSKERWEKLIGEDVVAKYKKSFLYNKNPRCQKLSEKNLRNEDAIDEEHKNQFKMIIEALGKE